MCRAFSEALVGGVSDLDLAPRNLMLMKWGINGMFYWWKIIDVVCIV